MDWPSPCLPSENGKRLKVAAVCPTASQGSCIWLPGLLPLKFSCPADAGGGTSTEYPPLPSREEGQGKWYCAPGWWQHGLFYLPVPYGFWNIESNQGELMHPVKSWASTEAHFYSCQKMKSAGVPWQDSHGRQQLCWVVASPLCFLIPAREILLVALELLIPIRFFLVIFTELVPDQWCCTTLPPESWMCLMQILRVAGSPLFKETVSSLTQPPGTSSCETWFYQPRLFFC